MFEMGGIKEEVAREALRLATYKLPCGTKIVTKADFEQNSVKPKEEA